MRTVTMLALGGLLVATTAAAQTTERTTERMERRAERWTDRLGPVEVNAGLGLGDFAQDLGRITDLGLAWNARVGVQPWRFLGGEIAYQGLNGDASFVQPQAGLISEEGLTQHQFTADAKVQYPVMLQERELRPYALVGLGVSRINTTDALAASGLDDDTTLAIPVGAGVAYDLNQTFVLDGRFTYNILSGVDMPLVNDNADSWTALVNVGARFGRR